MPQKETDLLRDPLTLAQQRYQEQVQAFKDQYIPKPSRREIGSVLREYGLDPKLLRKI